MNILNTCKSRIRASILRLLKSARSQDGHSLVELSFVLPLLVTPVIAVLHFGPVLYAAIEVSSAARAGVAYGAQTLVTAANTSGMQTAATNDGPEILNWKPTGLTATATQYCVCSNGTSTTCANAAATCTSPSHPLEYVKVSTQATFNPLFYLPGLPTTYTLNSQATMRVE
jgi:Flp pilus assembly protein TadG